MGQPGVLFSRSRGSTKMGLPLRNPVAKLSCEAATEENAKRRSFMPRTQVTGKANFSPGITSGLPVTREERPGMSPNLQMFAQDCSEKDLRAICEGLFVPQRHHGIDTHRAPCWDVASECGDSDQSERCEKHRLDICGLHTKKQCGHEACYAHSASHTRNDSNQSYRHATPEDEP